MTRTLPEIDMDISIALRGASDLFAERAKAQMPVDPPPPAPPLPVVDLSAYRNWFTPDTPSQVITVRSSQPVPLEVQASLRITVFAPEGAQISANLESPLVIKAGELFGTATITVKQFPPAGESATFNIELTGAQNAVIGVQSKVTFTVNGPPVVVPPPEPLHVSLETSPADPPLAMIPESSGLMHLSVKLSRALDTDLVVQLQASGTARFGDDYTCPESITVPAGQQTASVIVETFDDGVYEKNEDLVIAIVPSDAYVIDQGSVQITIVDDDKEPEPPPVDPPPTNPDPPAPQPYTVRKEHGRLYWHGDIRNRITSPQAIGILKNLAAIADTDATTRLVDTPLCCASLWKLAKEGMPLPDKTATGKARLYSAEQYRDRAIAKALVLAQTPINLAGNHYATNHLHPLAILYDWLFDDMTEEQRAPIRATLAESLNAAKTLKRVNAAGNPVPVQSQNLYEPGYNAHSGSGMTPALAIHGETDTDWVRHYWDENWWTAPAKGGYYNREFEENWLSGGGNTEDWGYFPNQLQIRAAKAAWESATGDTKSLDYPWMTRNSLLYLHQSMRVPVATGNKLRWRLMPTYGNGNNWLLLEAFWFAADTGSSDPTIASLAAWMLQWCQYAGQPAFDEFFWRCVVGDPRVVPKSPEELGLPFDYFVESTGLYYDRSDWTDDAVRVFFGCSEQLYRSTAYGNMMIEAKGLPLIADRSGTASHGYSGYGRSCMPMIRNSAGKVLDPLGGDGTPIRKKVASFTREGNRITADLTGLYPTAVTRMVRSVEYDRAAGVITITDECVPKPGFTPMASWPTPLKPQIGDASVVFTNGLATGAMTFDVAPAEIALRGGETDNLWAEDWDRSLYNPGNFTEWSKLPRDQQIAAGGFYTVYVTPAAVAGVYRLVTTIKVGP